MDKPMRITKLRLKNFKSIGEQTYDFGQFDLLVGRNNCGKSTILQALAIWQFCIDMFHHSSRSGNKGVQVVLPNFTALPLPEFNLLWKDRTDRVYPLVNGKKQQQYILIEIFVEWSNGNDSQDSFGVDLRYHSPQTIYAIPSGGWKRFREYENKGMPKIAYIPPFSGLEPVEKRLDVSPIRQQVGKGQPGSVLRNLLLSVNAPSEDEVSSSNNNPNTSQNWHELADKIKTWFSVEIHEPIYDPLKDVYIKVEYQQEKKKYDIIAGGSGFHQTLTLMAFLFGYQPTTILLDEPDAHLHVSLQREVLDYFKLKSHETGMQFLIATHAEEFIRGVEVNQIVSLLAQEPKRIQSTPQVVRAMAEVSNTEVERLLQFPCILYVEGHSDERILRAWADQCAATDIMAKICFKTMNGGNKRDMKDQSEKHYGAVKQIIPNVSRAVLFDYDDDNYAFHPKPDNPALAEWKRKNIENYLLVPDAWKRAAEQEVGPLFAGELRQLINDFFTEENLTLPPNKTWRNVTANVFSMVDGKRILFENNNSLFHRLRNSEPNTELRREMIAQNMTADEIHEDVHEFFQRLKNLPGTS